jgi:hypothetical protein
MGKSTLILVLGTFTIFGILNFNVKDKLTDTTEEASNYYSQNFVRNSCNSMVEMLISDLEKDGSYQAEDENYNFYNCDLTYSVTDTTIESSDFVKIDVSGDYNGATHQVSAIVSFPSSDGNQLPPGVKGAITTNNLIELKGKLEVDGRNHDKDGNLIPNTGTYGTWTTQTSDRKGAATVGGTNNGTDYNPQKTSDTAVAAINQAYPGGYPSSPDEVMGGDARGYPEGTLKAIAQSGDDGSQYTTNPSNLSYPLSGVTYVELGSGETWNPADITGSGILIVHNSSLDAKIKNLNWGTFKGLLIVDDIIHIHADILGAVVGLTPNPSEGNCVGNGNGTVKYSRELVANSAPSSGSSGSEGGGTSGERIVVRSWYQ